ncbi:MAG TPA: STAS domain-containing protein, partial [Pseudonocardiaceae bacterium]|nr:STAS domain-containing protein [Pseudonocardiaceae bacterium]
ISGTPRPGDGDAEDLRVTVEARGDAIVLAVAGELDMLTAGGLRQAIVTVLDSRPRVLVVDLSKVEFMASAGMNVLVEADEAAGSATLLRVVATGNVTMRPLRVTGLAEYLAVFESLDAALAES